MFGRYLRPQVQAAPASANFMMAATVRNFPVPTRTGDRPLRESAEPGPSAKSAPAARRRLDTDGSARMEGGDMGASSSSSKEAEMQLQIAMQQKQIADLAQLVQALQVFISSSSCLHPRVCELAHVRNATPSFLVPLHCSYSSRGCKLLNAREKTSSPPFPALIPSAVLFPPPATNRVAFQDRAPTSRPLKCRRLWCRAWRESLLRGVLLARSLMQRRIGVLLRQVYPELRAALPLLTRTPPSCCRSRPQRKIQPYAPASILAGQKVVCRAKVTRTRTNTQSVWKGMGVLFARTRTFEFLPTL